MLERILMDFSSLTFIYLFIPAVLLVHGLVPAGARNPVLLAFSLLCGAWENPLWALLLTACALLNGASARAIARARDEKSGREKKILVRCLLLDAALLAVFKAGPQLFPAAFPGGIPLGISFYALQALSSPVDVYMGRSTAPFSLLNFTAGISLFPRLAAGPLMANHDLQEEMLERQTNARTLETGIRRFVEGLAKKVLLADGAGAAFQAIASLPAEQASTASAWLGIIFFAFQIYFDLSGFSDMAIGLGSMLGFAFPENFNYPYAGHSVSDFCHSWHITLLYWFQVYVYDPLCARFHSASGEALSLVLVYVLLGLWYGFTLNHALWGLYMGLLVLLEKKFLGARLRRLPKWISHLYMIVMVLLGWTLLAFPTPQESLAYLRLLLGQGSSANALTLYFLRNNGFLLTICFIADMPLAKTRGNFFRKRLGHLLEPWILAFLLIAATAYLVQAGGSSAPLIRF
jgi:alginate O-acetyltransferase complex protein AlgI